MKQLLILSGKGGTGKTTIASAFIKLADARAYADCDVDAPNLHLVMQQASQGRFSDYYGLGKANIDNEICIHCGICKENCRFDAIEFDEDNNYIVNNFACEGCGVCEFVCPANAVHMEDNIAGELELYADGHVFSTATLKMGEGTSGLLVSDVKKNMKSAAENIDLAIIDGSPGIGCPVIASLSGVDMVLIVSEPSISGISDMKRIIYTADKFQIKTLVCVNKYDTNIENTDEIIKICKEMKIPFVGKTPYDYEALKAVNSGYTIVDVDCMAGRASKEIFNNTMKILKGREEEI